MLGKTFLKRTDAAVMNELVGKWLIKQNPEWHGKFIVSQKGFGRADYRIMFSKKWKNFVDKFNQELREMKENGELEKIISKYQ